MYFVSRAFRFAKSHRSLLATVTLGLGIGITSLGYGMQQAHNLAAQQALNYAKEQKTAYTAQLQAKDTALQNATKQSTDATSKTPSPVPAATVITTAPKNTATSTTIRYSTSPDPRSTASSTTPPAPNPASFDIPITHANQVTAGTVISYNATKGERIIYGGDLVLSQSTFTYYHNTNGVYTNEVNFTVSSPDGSTVEMPGLPYNVQANGIVVSMDSSQYKSTGSSFPMMIDVYNSNLAAGSYNIHIVTNRTTEGADAYEYDGFLTVNVVD
jgi:cytoskeletal protein RodZ